jgi:cytochrome c biogenesis protein CcmG, thiol:disulfide interchange protein DsbE
MNRLHHAALALLLAFALAGSLGCSGTPEPEVPRTAPDFSLAALDGERVRLSEHRGQVVLLDFWATWCPPCRASIPHLVEMQDKYRGDGFTVIGMNMDHDGEDLAAFLRRHTLNYPVVKVTEDVRAAYGGVISIPVAFAVDRRGLVRRSFLGYDRRIAKDMEQTIQTLLREPP